MQDSQPPEMPDVRILRGVFRYEGKGGKMTKIVKIDSCWDCPYIYTEDSYHGYYASCGKNGYKDVHPNDGIPSWCPLEDVRE
jgi:hypothetical protein